MGFQIQWAGLIVFIDIKASHCNLQPPSNTKVPGLRLVSGKTKMALMYSVGFGTAGLVTTNSK